MFTIVDDPVQVSRSSPLIQMNAGIESFLKATVKATPVDADGHGSTDQLVDLAVRIQRDA
jgi:hypothetical protein